MTGFKVGDVVLCTDSGGTGDRLHVVSGCHYRVMFVDDGQHIRGFLSIETLEGQWCGRWDQWRFTLAEKGMTEIKESKCTVEQALKVLREAGTVDFTPKWTPVRVRLNNSYTAVIGEDVVVVGCQRISHDKIREVYNALPKETK